MKTKTNNGITLIALVITIIVLLILAGVTIAMLTGENGILNQASESKTKTEIAEAKERAKIDIMSWKSKEISEGRNGYINDSVVKNILTGKEYVKEAKANSFISKKGNHEIAYSDLYKSEQTDEDEKPVPIGLEVGSKITYTPRGTYNWKSEYSSLNPDSEKTLNSADYMYKINEWKVLDIQDEKVTLVPTTMTIGNVSLGWAQGYNNGVKLLNDACSSLYGNESKGISARSINIEDIEKYMSVEKLEIAHKYENVAKYGEQVVEPYTSPIWYPIIYEKEKLSVIDERKNTDGLGMSEQSILIEKTENGSSDGTMMATSI